MEITKIETGIPGLEVDLQKVIGDHRGFLAEMLPGGMDHPVAKNGIRNIYMSVATGKHVGRAAHYHYKNHEIFYTLSGTALWLFHDFRKDSPSSGKSFEIILGHEKPEDEVHHPVVVLDDLQFACVSVPVEVYHAYWPLTDEKVRVVAVASESHSDDDYWRGKPNEVPGFVEILGKYGIYC